MLAKMLEKNVLKNINFKTAIIITIVFVLFLVLVLPWFSATSYRATGVKDSPDTSFIYTAEDLYQVAESYKEEGRRSYIVLRWTFDVIWPFVYMSFLVVWTVLLGKIISHKRYVHQLYKVAISAMIFDFFENIGATIVMARYPVKSGVVAIVTPYMTSIKWGLLGASFMIVVVMMIVLILKILFDREGL